MSAGCSAVAIHAGISRGLAKWLPINARDALGVTSRCCGIWQEKSLAWTKSLLFARMRISGKCPSKPFSHKLSRDIVPGMLGSKPFKPVRDGPFMKHAMCLGCSPILSNPKLLLFEIRALDDFVYGTGAGIGAHWLRGVAPLPELILTPGGVVPPSSTQNPLGSSNGILQIP
eukprot:6388909-Amphidinium_carterae.1